MKQVFPAIFTPVEGGYMVFVPDFQINTQGDSLAEAIEMARDAIGLMGIDMEDDGKPLPTPSPFSSVSASSPDDIVALVDVDFVEYRRMNDMRAVKKNCTIPSWLNFEAEPAGINFSATLQAALKKELGIQH